MMWGAAGLPPRQGGRVSNPEVKAEPCRHLGFTAGWFAKATQSPCQRLSSSSAHVSSRIAYAVFSLSG